MSDMKAVVIREAGGPEVLNIETVPVPTPKAGWVLIKVRAFGLNRSELFARQGHSPNVPFPASWALKLLAVVHKAEQGAWLSNDGANHRLALLSAPGLSDDPAKFKHAGLHHTAYEFKHFDELVDAFERLVDDGIEPAFCLNHGMTISMYYRDPDGNFVELQVDVFGDWASSKAHSHRGRLKPTRLECSSILNACVLPIEPAELSTTSTAWRW